VQDDAYQHQETSIEGNLGGGGVERDGQTATGLL
jgi:hypothetical protein